MIIGVTGGLGCGKSTVLGMMKDSGWKVVDADAVVHGLLKSEKSVICRVRAHFGRAMVRPDGAIDRKKLAGVVFGSPRKMKGLEGIIHPLVTDILAEKIGRARKKGYGLAVEIPLLYEKKLQWLVDRVVVVYCSRRTMKERLVKKYGIDGKEACRRIAMQAPVSMKKKLAEFTIENECRGRSELRKKVMFLCRQLEGQAGNT